MVWPLMILSVLAVLTMLISLFSEGVILSCSHMSLREVAGKWSKTVSFNADAVPFPEKFPSKNIPEQLQMEKEERINQSGIPILRSAEEGNFAFRCLYPQFSLRTEKSYGGVGLLSKEIKKGMEAGYQSVDEAQIIRNLDYAVEIGKEVKEQW